MINERSRDLNIDENKFDRESINRIQSVQKEELSLEAVKAMLQGWVKTEEVTAWSLSNGIDFSQLLSSVRGWEGEVFREQLCEGNALRIQKEERLQRLKEQINEFLETQGYGIKMDDVDLSQAAIGSHGDVVRFFQGILLVLMLSANKEQYITHIMGLDSDVQAELAQVLQRAMQTRLLQKNEIEEMQLEKEVKVLRSENARLKGAVEELLEANRELENRKTMLEDTINRFQAIAEDRSCGQETRELREIGEQQTGIIEALKEKLLQTAREHEAEVSEMMGELNGMRERNEQFQALQQIVQFYRSKYESTVAELERINQWDKEKQKQEAVLMEKELSLDKLNSQLSHLTAKLLETENTVFEKDMQIQKLEFKLREQLKVEKNRLSVGASLQVRKTALILGGNNKELQREQQGKIDQFRRMAECYERKNKELLKENAKLLKKVDGAKLAEAEKKKLESIILDINFRNQEELELMAASLYEVHKEYSTLFKTFARRK